MGIIALLLYSSIWKDQELHRHPLLDRADLPHGHGPGHLDRRLADREDHGLEDHASSIPSAASAPKPGPPPRSSPPRPPAFPSAPRTPSPARSSASAPCGGSAPSAGAWPATSSGPGSSRSRSPAASAPDLSGRLGRGRGHLVKIRALVVCCFFRAACWGGSCTAAPEVPSFLGVAVQLPPQQISHL